MKVVIALGGNAMQKRDEPLEAEVQRQNVARAATAIASIARTHRVVVTHGNGPQMGLFAMQAAAYSQALPYPSDVLGAETEGMIGYMIEQELRSLLPEQQIVTLLTQVEVNLKDPAFKRPSKPIGPEFDRAKAQQLGKKYRWAMGTDGKIWRRVVPSPEPLRILEINVIRLLVASGALVVCAGGGGIPVTVSASGVVRGIEAVIDKDLAAGLLAHELGADALLLLTDVDAVYLGWGTDKKRALSDVSPEGLRQHAFAPGSMKPKVDAVCRFVESGGAFAGIGRLEDAVSILLGHCGTIVHAPATTLDFVRRPG
jgi:carbamate kinase